MNLLKTIWENVWGLLVEDGWIASGTVGALLATALWALLAGANESLRDAGGWLLLAMLMALLLANLYVAGQNAARKRIS